jgi:hypothetical protein
MAKKAKYRVNWPAIWAAAALVVSVVACQGRSNTSSADTSAPSGECATASPFWECWTIKLKMIGERGPDGFQSGVLLFHRGGANPTNGELAGGPEEATTATIPVTATPVPTSQTPSPQATAFRYRTSSWGNRNGGQDLCRVYYIPEYPVVSFECNRARDFEFAKDMFQCEHRNLRIADDERVRDYDGGPFKKRWVAQLRSSRSLYRCDLEVFREDERRGSEETQSVSNDPYRLAQTQKGGS